MSSDKDGIDHVHAGIQASLDANEWKGIVTSFVVVATWVDEAGQQRTYFAQMNDQRIVETLGLLEYAQSVTRRTTADQWMRRNGPPNQP